ncbi:MAG: adenylyltransferase/cytidyltransferase family protein [Chlamydiae bacterium]|nr:adenylyltransferase/cytidyltransferase family protein [Chlamydiota bacterium]
MIKVLFSLFILLFSVPSLSDEKTNKVVVYTDVVGDLFHLGHVEFFKRARALGDYLIVGVLEDHVVEEYKRTPILTLEERVRVIQACKYVDEVIVAPPLRLTENLIKEWNISYVVHGDDFSPELLEDQYGTAMRLGILKLLPYTTGISTTNIIERITSRYELGEFHKK